MRSYFGGFSAPSTSRILLDVAGGEGGGSGGSPPEPPPKAPTVEEVVKKHGNADAAMLWLVSRLHEVEKDNYTQRGEIRTLKTQAPASGSRVLTAEEAAELDRYRSLGKPEVITASLKERDTLSKEVEQGRRDKEIAGIAKDEKWNPEVLARSVKDEQFVRVEAKDKDGNTIKGDDNKPKQIWAVKGATDADAPVPVQEHFSVLLPALFPKEDDGHGNGTPSREFKRADSSVPSGTEKPSRSLFL